jgi:Holliday junction resolvase RusA-like endonuclease
MEENKIVVEFTEDNLDRFLKEYYKTHRMSKDKKTGKDKPIIDSPIARSMNKILVITNRIVQNNHKHNRGLYTEFVLKELGLEKLGICETNLKIHFVFGTSIRHDIDNFNCGVKEYLDAFSDLGVIQDDNYQIIKSITSTASYEKGVSKMIFTFENCKFDVQATLEAMEKERIKREKRETTMSEKKKTKKKK